MTDEERAQLWELMMARWHALSAAHKSLDNNDGDYNKRMREYDRLSEKYHRLLDKSRGFDPFPEF